MNNNIAELTTETKLRLPDHEVLISFNDDLLAEWFTEWWYEDGLRQFKKHIEDFDA